MNLKVCTGILYLYQYRYCTSYYRPQNSCTCIGTGTGQLVQAAAGGRQRAARTMHCIALSQIQCPQWECCGPLYAKKVVHSGN